MENINQQPATPESPAEKKGETIESLTEFQKQLKKDLEDPALDPIKRVATLSALTKVTAALSEKWLEADKNFIVKPTTEESDIIIAGETVKSNIENIQPGSTLDQDPFRDAPDSTPGWRQLNNQ